MKYNINKCNIHNCKNNIYKDGLCKYHYDFYMKEEFVKRSHDRFELLRKKKAGFKLRLQNIFQIIVHYSFAFPMPFVEHFPLEHIFLSELQLLRKKHDKIDVDRYENIIRDFDCKENENLESMKRLLYTGNLNELKLTNLDDYLFNDNKLFSKIIFILPLMSLISTFVILKINVSDEFIFCGLSIEEFCNYFNAFLFLALFFVIVLRIGISIPSTFNGLIRRSYDLSLFENINDNIELLHQSAYVKNRKDKGDYFANIAGYVLGNIIMSSICFFKLSSINWYTLILFVSVVVFISTMIIMYMNLPFFYPIMECIKKKNVKIELFNPDHMGGLKAYHSFLFRTFMYNFSFLMGIWILNGIVNKWWFTIFVFLICLPRVNHARWSFKMYYNSIRIFLKKKGEMLNSLSLKNDVASLETANHLQHVNWTRFNIVFKQICLIILIPLMMNNRENILNFISKKIQLIWSYIQI